MRFPTRVATVTSLSFGNLYTSSQMSSVRKKEGVLVLRRLRLLKLYLKIPLVRRCKHISSRWYKPFR